MNKAKQMKLKEYGTDVLSHATDNNQNSNTSRVRANNTFKSNVMN
jgi:hypothetical protein